MNIHHVLFLCFVSGALCDIPIFTKTEGDSLLFGCIFGSPTGQRFFTKKEPGTENVLIETSGISAQRGRYGIQYDTEVDVFYVSISQLQKADSGRYRCGLGNSSVSSSHREFEVQVTDAMCTLTNPGITTCVEPEGGSIRIRCSFSSAGLFNLFFCKDECKKQDVLIETDGFKGQRGRYRIEYERDGVFYATIANLTMSDSGVYMCGVDVRSSLNPCLVVNISVTDAPTTSEPSSTLLPFTSVPSASSSGSCTPATAFPLITPLFSSTAPLTAMFHNLSEQQQSELSRKAYVVPLVVCLTVVAVLLVVILLVLFKKKRKGRSYGSNVRESPGSEEIECATY